MLRRNESGCDGIMEYAKLGEPLIPTAERCKHHFVPAAHLRRWSCRRSGTIDEVFNALPGRNEYHLNNVRDIMVERHLYALRHDGGISDAAEKRLMGEVDDAMDNLFNEIDISGTADSEQKSLLARIWFMSTLRTPSKLHEVRDRILQGLGAHKDNFVDGIEGEDFCRLLGPEFVSACRRYGFEMVERHAELIALAASWEQSEQADRLARARLLVHRCSEPGNSFITGDAFSAKGVIDRARVTIIPISWSTCAIFREDDVPVQVGDENLFCSYVNQTIWRTNNHRCVFYPDAPYVKDLGLFPSKYVTRRFPKGWNPVRKNDLAVSSGGSGVGATAKLIGGAL